MIITIDTEKKTLLVSGNIKNVESVNCLCHFNSKKAMIEYTAETFKGKEGFYFPLCDKINTAINNGEKSLFYYNNSEGG